jgi:Uma2 family endonuclease
MATQTRLTLDEFLALPEKKPYREFFAGEVIEKVAPDPAHGTIVSGLNQDIRNTVDREAAALEVMTEVRHEDRAQDWVYLPDVSVTRRDRLPADWLKRRRGPLQVTPDFAIEVLSPDDEPADVRKRVDQYMKAGLRLLWILDADSESIAVYEPGKASRTHRSPDVLDAGPVFPEFKLDIGAFFDRLYRRHS